MYNIKRIGAFIAVVIVITVIASSFMGEDIMGRAIIIGLGVDGSDEGVRVTAEIISPSSGEQVGSFSKTVSVNGKSIANAVTRIAELTGKEASLGRCMIIMFGQDYYENTDLSSDIEYLISSDSFKESSTVCCVEGKAEDFLNNSAAMTQGVSLALSEMFNAQEQQTATVINSLLDFTLSQRGLIKTGFLNKVQFVPSTNTNPDEPDKPQGYFDLGHIAVFADNKYMRMLTDEEIDGFALLDSRVTGSTFVCKYDGKDVTVTIDSKDIKRKLQEDNTVTYQLNLQGKAAHTDSGEVGGIFVAQNQKELPQAVIDDVIAQATEQINALITAQQQYNFDLIKLHETIRQKTGSNDELDNLPTADIKVDVVITFKEK